MSLLFIGFKKVVVVAAVVVVVVAAAIVVTLAVVVEYLRMILCVYIVGFSCFLKRRPGPTDLWREGRMDGPMGLWTDGPTEIPSYRDARTHVKIPVSSSRRHVP